MLIDWSVRESFHILKYLSQQTEPRSNYEILWIEFYDSTAAMRYAADKFIILNIPRRVCYHKHLLYNVGIANSSGEIVLFCDSDAILTKTFVRSVLYAFEQEPRIVLHVDQVRNHNKRFYPFSYPSIELITAKGQSNWRNRTTTGMLDNHDSLHRRNYGACMAARREDLIAIGGADEHIDYLGYICGPYDMTFRLINAGVPERWHTKEFVYHVWHPNAGGGIGHEGPHDGQKMSSRALANRDSKRILPFVENPLIRNPDCGQFVSQQQLDQWMILNPICSPPSSAPSQKS